MVVETVSRLAQWRSATDNFGNCNIISKPFKIGMWNWQLSNIVQNGYQHAYIYLSPKASRLSKEQSPLAEFTLRLTAGSGTNKQVFVSPVFKRLLRTFDDFVWTTESYISGSFIIEVEFLNLRVHSANGYVGSSVWPSDGLLKSSTTEGSLGCLSHMLHESINTDVTINTCDGSLKAHKAILSASSPVFHSMFRHDLKEKTSSTIDIQDMSLESCATLLCYLYGTITHENFWKHRYALLGAANKYAISRLTNICEESLLEDISTGNVLERLQEAWLYQLDKLNKGCLTYLFYFGKIRDIKLTSF
ncbi:BTB/POZ domain-containing protein At1g21780-like [Bidens hawaiensis]|uniref:BTB/POZ domain-containing protein At1g21780-like n=1 Tax=Bidens hawaiensis TaxID=980011 RepID=UPI00404B1CFE